MIIYKMKMKSKSKSKTKISILVGIIMLIVIGSIIGYFVYRKNKSSKHNTENKVHSQDTENKVHSQDTEDTDSRQKILNDITKKWSKGERNEIKCIRRVNGNPYDCDEFLQNFYHYDPKNFNYDPYDYLKNRDESDLAQLRYYHDNNDQTTINYLVDLSGIKTVNGKLRHRIVEWKGKFEPKYTGYPNHIFGYEFDPYYDPDPTNFKLEKLNKKDTSENLYSFTFTIKPSETVKLKGIRYKNFGFKRIIISSQNGDIIYDGETSNEYLNLPEYIQIDENDIKNNLLVKNQEYNVTFWMNNMKYYSYIPGINGLKFYI
jgi:hypothetical protein